MNVVFKTSTKLVIGEYKQIVASYEEKCLTIECSNGLEDGEYTTIEINIEEFQVSEILDKIYKDIKQNNGICVLDYL